MNNPTLQPPKNNSPQKSKRKASQSPRSSRSIKAKKAKYD